MVGDMATKLVKNRDGEDKEEVGEHWINRFLKRWPDLAAKVATTLERQRMSSNDPAIIKDLV